MKIPRTHLMGIVLMLSLLLGLNALQAAPPAPTPTQGAAGGRGAQPVPPSTQAPATANDAKPATTDQTVPPPPGGTTPGPNTEATPEVVPPAPLPPPVDFRDLAAHVGNLTVPVVWQQLPRFGLALFARAEQTEGQPAQGVSVPTTYVLGPGDELAVRCFSEAIEHQSTTVAVSPEGKIYIPLLGDVPVAGGTLSTVRLKIAELLRQFYPKSQTTVDLTQPRVIDLYVLGDVLRPGKYSLPGMGTLFTALYAAGGPSDVGSLRRVKRLPLQGEPVSYDLYSYLLEGERVSQELLNPGDTIFVGTKQAEVGIVGEVRRSACYEVKPDTTCAELIRMAGGIAPMAYTPNIQVWRVKEGEARTISSLSLKATTEFKLQDGDLVVIRPILEDTRQTVSAEGAVRRPGMYELRANMRVADLLAKAEGPLDTAHLGTAMLLHLNDELHWEVVNFKVAGALAGLPADNLLLQPRDRVHLFTQDEAEQPQVVQITGPLTHAGEFAWGPGMRVSDLVLRAGGMLPEAYGHQATLIRFRETDAEREVIQVRLADALRGDKAADLELFRGDLLQVFTKDEQRQKSEVWVEGLVLRAGAYPRYENMKISDLIFAAGGLAPGASGKGVHSLARQVGKTRATEIQITQEKDKITVTPDLVLSDDDYVAVNGEGTYVRRPPHVKITGRVADPGSYGLTVNTDEKTTVYDVLEQAGGLLPDANPRGILLFRPKSEVWINRQDLLQKALAGLNRTVGATPNAALETPSAPGKPTTSGTPAAAGTPTAPGTATTSGAGATAATPATATSEQAALGGQVASVFTKGTGDDQVVGVIIPPRNLNLSSLVEIVPIDGQKLLATKGEEGDAVLADDDYIVVQRTLDTVAVFGAVMQSGEIAYVPRESVRAGILRVGGMTPDADARYITVLRANGKALPAAQVRELQQGDIVIVPSKYLIRTEGGARPFFDRLWAGLMQAFALSRILK